MAKQAETPKYWAGNPGECDFKATDPGNEHSMATFVDGKTRRGPWANMCLRCFRIHGGGLGTGQGQEYKLQEDGRWLKTAG